ncbi:MAG: imidazole glycerol phosphate synthase subunit HisH [Sphingomicrobium sp.]
MSDITILDLGYGNTRSVALAFERLGATCALTAEPAAAASARHLVLPGVGAAGVAMRRLSEADLIPVLHARSAPTLGICLGMQLLFDRSDEDGGTDLLELLTGNVEALVPAPGFPVPHMGWSKLEGVVEGMGLAASDYVYFAHGFACPDTEFTAARTRYGNATIPSAVRKDNLWGAQFHPERSSAAGASFLRAFLES